MTITRTAPTPPPTDTTNPGTTNPGTTNPAETVRAPGLLGDTWLVLVRELRPMLRDPATLVIAMVQPLVFLALFAPLLPDVGGAGSALQWFVPGIVAMTALMGASMTGSNLMQEMATGSHERLLVSPLSRASLLLGRALKEVVPAMAQTAIIVAAVTPFSFDLHPAGVLVGAVVAGVFAVGVGSLSFALALAVKDQDWVFWTVQQTLIFPFLLLAGVLLPLEGAPGWLRFCSDVNPLTYVVEAERALFAGTWPASEVLGGVGAALAVALVGLAVGLRAMRRAA